MAPSEPRDVWAIGEAYEPYVGRWSRLVARTFVDWLAVPAGARWLDLGCGTGALSQAVLERCQPRAVTGVDPSEGYIADARRRVPDARVRFCVGDGGHIPADDGAFDAVVSGLVLNFVPDKEKAIAEMRRIVRPAGTIAIYVWDYAEKMELMRYFWDAAVALDQAARPLDEGRRFPICNPRALRDLFGAAGLSKIDLRAIDAPTVFKNFDDYWTPFLGGQAPAPGYCMSLPEAGRNALREALRVRLPIRQDGTIHLIARAWAVRAVALPVDRAA